MQSALAECDAGHLLLESVEQEREFYSVTTYLGCADARTFGIGICSEGHGISPSLLLQPEASTLVFGFNSNVTAVSVADKCVSYTVALDSVFYEFLPSTNENEFFVVHEIGVVALSSTGRTVWKYSQDVVTGVDIRSHLMYLDFMDSPSVALDLGRAGRSQPA